jgi:hypothetical protein
MPGAPRSGSTPSAAFHATKFARPNPIDPGTDLEQRPLIYCEKCQGYLKTYEREGNEVVLLADWTSLHLDLLARDRGLKRLAASLYEV